MKKKVLANSTLLLISCLASSIVLAGGAAPFYIGGSIGISSTDDLYGDMHKFEDCGDDKSKKSHCGVEDHSRTASVYGGIRLDERFGVEVGYIDLGDTVTLHDNDAFSVEQKTKGIVAQGVIRQRLGQTSPLLAYGKAGIVRWDSEAELQIKGNNGENLKGSVQQNGYSPTLGGGLEFEVSRNMTLRAGWDRYYHVGKGDVLFNFDEQSGQVDMNTLKTTIDVWSAGLSYDFL